MKMNVENKSSNSLQFMDIYLYTFIIFVEISNRLLIFLKGWLACGKFFIIENIFYICAFELISKIFRKEKYFQNSN